ncbi:MAG TPA: histidinol-phosphate transaminase [Chitinophagaceae bacterium]|nr:histidinol-phosphate transaminase [Chitinophagaceae bacterium]
MPNASSPKIILIAASEQHREDIYNIRHAVYAGELNQHLVNSSNQLKDDLDLVNNYIVAKYYNQVIGFISITSPASKKYSVDKYFNRSSIPYPFDDYLYEIRLLTVIKENRNSYLALALMFAAFRWVQSHGGRYIMAICRTDLISMYCKAGLRPLHVSAESGKVTYELSVACIDDLQKMVLKKIWLYESLKSKIDWQLPYMFFAPSACYHGGSFFKAIGEDLQTLQKAKQIINADVLDAWFPPSPNVLKVLHENLSWFLQTSPPTHANGLIKVIAEVRGIKEQCILPGAGSSDLIFLALRSLLNKMSQVLIVDPCYGEYVHVLKEVIQCRITWFTLSRKELFILNTTSLLQEIKKGYDMIVLVNPNSPTGVHIPKNEMEKMLSQIPNSTLIWVDETYIEFAGATESLEQFAVQTENIIICKSMSKVYALSGARSAYLCCSQHLIETLKSVTPPWAISLPAQAAAITALGDPEYYKEKYAETHVLRNKLKQNLLDLGITEVVDGIANFLLFYLPKEFGKIDEFLKYCKHRNLFIRNVSNMGKSLGKNAVRIAVKDEETNNRMIDIMKRVLISINETYIKDCASKSEN